jgi:plastocyanin
MPKAMLLATTLGLLGACDPEDRQAPTTAEFVIEKAPEVSGDKQVGVAGEPLPEDLRARVTRDGRPAAGVTVYWTTMQGAMDPPEAVTDAEGISASRWTTQNTYLEEEAFASLDPVTAPRVPGSILPGMIMYTALAYPDPDAPTTVLVMNDNRFEPASIVVPAGGIVNWFWSAGSAGHNIVPDDGNAPATSGAPAGYPKYLSFTFANPGVYRYHCAVHGGPGGVGMSGSVTVLTPDPLR